MSSTVSEQNCSPSEDWFARPACSFTLFWCTSAFPSRQMVSVPSGGSTCQQNLCPHSLETKPGTWGKESCPYNLNGMWKLYLYSLWRRHVTIFLNLPRSFRLKLLLLYWLFQCDSDGSFPPPPFF